MEEIAPPDEPPYLTNEEFRGQLRTEIERLRADVRLIWDRYALDTPVRMRHTWQLEGREVSGPVWVIACAGTTLLGYDEFENEFGIGSAGTTELTRGGIVHDWGTFGEQLRWTLLRFPDPTAYMTSPAV